MSKMIRLSVFCGSHSGVRPEYADAARQLARAFCANNIGLVYGGSNIGLMKVLADSMLELGGDVIGVIPQFLVEKEIAHEDIAELHVVDTMQARKELMAKLSDGFILMPGSFGSLDEFFEMLTWTQLNLQQKPCAILNTENYYHSLLTLLDHAVTEQFLKPMHRDMIIVEQQPEVLVERLVGVDHHFPTVETYIKELISEHAE